MQLRAIDQWKYSFQNYGEGESHICSYVCHSRDGGMPRQVVGSREAALETLRVLRQVVSKARFSNIDQLVNLIRSVGRRLVEAQPKGAPLPFPLSATHALTGTSQSTPSETPCARSCTISARSTTRQ